MESHCGGQQMDGSMNGMWATLITSSTTATCSHDGYCTSIGRLKRMFTGLVKSHTHTLLVAAHTNKSIKQM